MARIIFNGRVFAKIKYFDCLRVSLVTNDGYSYNTSIPVSSIDFRENYRRLGEHWGSKANVEVKYDNKYYVVFKIHDDYGEMHTMAIRKSMKKEIEFAIESAYKNKLIPTALEILSNKFGI